MGPSNSGPARSPIRSCDSHWFRGEGDLGAELCIWGCSVLPRRSPGLVPFALPPAALFLQQCHFLRQAGHTEKAVSLFQAMVDFTFFKPDSVKGLPTKGQVRVLPESPAPISACPSSGEGCG